MNRDRLGLSRRPFRAAPSLDLYVPLPPHEAALNALRTAFAAGDGIALLDGAPGTGKSLLALKFLESLGRETVAVLIPSARFSKPSDLHQALLFDLGQEYRGFSEHELRLAVTERLLTELAKSRRIAMVLDEAQHLADELLEEIRLLDNLDAGGRKALFTLLVAQPDVRERLRRPEYELFAQRTRCLLRTESLADDEARTFLRSQLELCGQSAAEAMNDEAIELLVRHGGGNPRFLNRLAASAWDLANSAEADVVDVEAAGEALLLAGVELEETAESAGPAPPARAAKSKAASTGGTGEGRESARVRPPKQKAGNRRVA